MTQACLSATQSAAKCVEIDGCYVQVGSRLRTLVAILAEGCSEAELRREIDAIQPGHTYEARELCSLVDQLFEPHRLAIDEGARTADATWRLRAIPSEHPATGLESALRCRITIVPEGLANRLAQGLRFLYTPAGALLAFLFCAGAVARYLFIDGAASLSLNVLFTCMRAASAWSIAVAVAGILFASFIHELGHCSAVVAFGLRVRRIGFGIYWLSPALFSDVSAAWTLGRWQRVAVDCGGIYFQVIVCCLYALAILLCNSTPVQAGLRIAIVANLVALVSSLNPIMKCDGYWIVSDALSIPNLRRRSERAIRRLARAAFAESRPQPVRQDTAQVFLVSYGVLSLLFSATLLVLFAAVLRHNLSAAIDFPEELWKVLWANPGARPPGPAIAGLALNLLKLIPVACAPLAAMTAASGVAGFLRRTVSESD
jgi:hypothetical protein